MMRKRWRATLIVLLAGLATAAGAVVMPMTAAADPPPPPPDSFYDRPADLAGLAPGAIVRSRPVQIKSAQLFPVDVDAWQLAYRTTDADGGPDMTVTTVMVPRGQRPTKLLSYQAATDSTLRICNPSYSLTSGLPIDFSTPTGPLPFGLPGAEVLFAALGLREGWAVAMPDHGGVDARFLTPHQPGYNVLDGIRAVESFAPAGVTSDSPVTMWGYSGGAIASSWAIEEQPTYAPELTQIKGAALGAPERDLEASMHSVNGALLAGLIPLALSAMEKDSPSFSTALDKYLTPEGRARVDETANHCLGQNVLANMWFDYNRFLNTPLEQVLADPDIKAAIDERGITGRTPRVPAYVYNGVTEEVAPIVGTDRLVDSYCAGGASVTYHRELLPPNPLPQLITTHGTVVVTGAGAAFNWLRDRMNGQPAQTGCDIRTIPSSLADPAAIGTTVGAIGTILSTIVGLPVGVG